MKLIIEVEIKAEVGEYAQIKSVKCNGKEVEPEEDDIGRNSGTFYHISTGKELLINPIDLVQWDT